MSRWVARSNEEGDRPLKTIRSGRPRKTTIHQDQAIIDFVQQTPSTNTVLVREQLGLDISLTTIRDRLNSNGIHCRAPAKKPKLTPEAAAARLRFCHENMDRDWSCVVFSDEKTFCTSQNVRTTLWRRNNTRYNVDNVIDNRRSGRISAGYWGWMTSHGPGELVQVTPPRFGADHYVAVVQDVLLPSIRAIYPEEDHPTIVFVQDNSPIHTARVVRDWFNDHPEIELLQWPARSPDLNPIEHLWAAMVQRWNDVPFNGVRERTQEELDAHVRTVWESFRGRNFCRTLVIPSMQNRLEECVNNNGYYTSY